jgi:hypothetical protein
MATEMCIIPMIRPRWKECEVHMAIEVRHCVHLEIQDLTFQRHCHCVCLGLVMLKPGVVLKEAILSEIGDRNTRLSLGIGLGLVVCMTQELNLRSMKISMSALFHCYDCYCPSTSLFSLFESLLLTFCAGLSKKRGPLHGASCGQCSRIFSDCDMLQRPLGMLSLFW